MISLSKLNKIYRLEAEDLHVLKDLNLEVYEKDFIAMMGESGSGKSTLINIIGFLDNQFDGSYLFNGLKINDLNDNQLSAIRNRSVGFVFQQFQLIQNYSIRDNVRLPLLYQGMGEEEANEKAAEALGRVGIGDKLHKFPRQLSGGQQQRAAIARSIVHRPFFLIADEPTGALDSETSDEIIAMFRDLNQQDQMTIIMVTHDPNMTKYCNRTFSIRDGILHERSGR